MFPLTDAFAGLFGSLFIGLFYGIISLFFGVFDICPRCVEDFTGVSQDGVALDSDWYPGCTGANHPVRGCTTQQNSELQWWLEGGGR